MKKQRLSLIWRTLIVFAGTIIIWLISGQVNTFFQAGADYSRTGHVLAAIIVFTLAVPMIIFARKYLDKRPWSGLKLTSFKHGWKAFVLGGLSYFIPASLSMMVFALFGWTSINLHVSIGELLTSIVVIAFLVFIFEAFPEELIFRGYFFRNLNTRFSKLNAVIIQSILFTLFGFIAGSATTLNRIAFFAAVAFLVGMIRVITENVWGAIGFHLVFQTFQQMFTFSYNQELSTTTPSLTQFIILGIIPFSLAILVLYFFKEEPDWKEVDPE